MFYFVHVISVLCFYHSVFQMDMNFVGLMYRLIEESIKATAGWRGEATVTPIPKKNSKSIVEPRQDSMVTPESIQLHHELIIAERTKSQKIQNSHNIQSSSKRRVRSLSPRRYPYNSSPLSSPSTRFIPTIITTSHHSTKHYTIYHIQTTWPNNTTTLVMRRFDLFLWLADALSIACPEALIPSVPEKKVIG